MKHGAEKPCGYRSYNYSNILNYDWVAKSTSTVCLLCGVSRKWIYGRERGPDGLVRNTAIGMYGPRCPLDIRELISFYHTARLSRVSQAARFLELGQPTVTAHLQRLEQDIGSDLFDRNRSPIKLTPQGRSCSNWPGLWCHPWNRAWNL